MCMRARVPLFDPHQVADTEKKLTKVAQTLKSKTSKPNQQNLKPLNLKSQITNTLPKEIEILKAKEKRAVDAADAATAQVQTNPNPNPKP